MSRCDVAGPARVALALLSSLLAGALLVQFFIAGMAAMTNPAWWDYHRAWVAAFQWLVLPLPFLGWAAMLGWRWTMFAALPIVQIALQYVLVHRALEGRLGIGVGLHAVNAALMLVVALLIAGISIRARGALS